MSRIAAAGNLVSRAATWEAAPEKSAAPCLVAQLAARRTLPWNKAHQMPAAKGGTATGKSMPLPPAPAGYPPEGNNTKPSNQQKNRTAAACLLPQGAACQHFIADQVACGDARQPAGGVSTTGREFLAPVLGCLHVSKEWKGRFKEVTAHTGQPVGCSLRGMTGPA